jgi:hypothetical protein
LAEGVDVPSLDGVAFIDPRGSQVEIIQAVGRAIRKVRGADVQTKGTIVIPVFIEDSDDPEESIEVSNFKPVWDVLKALRAHDEILADTLDQYRTNMAKVDSDRRQVISDKIIFDIPMSVDAEFSSALRTFLVEATTESWEFWFGLLESYKAEFGDCLVTRGSKYRNYNLALWVSRQRFNDIQLTCEKRARLDELGFVWNVREYEWEEAFKHLLAYKKEFGDCLVIRGSKFRNYNLGSWVSKQRSKKGKLTSEQRIRLTDLGFVWDVLEYQWEEGFKHLVAYKKEYGDCRVVGKSAYRNHNLGIWVGHQRSTRARLTLEQRNQLDDLGFDWDPYKTDWDEGFEYLVAYKKEYGDCLIQVETRYCGYKLGKWVRTQRASYDQLTPERLKLLDGLGFVRNPAKLFWDRAFELLVAYKKEFGDCFVSGTYKYGDFALGGWVNNQRMNEEKLTSEQRIRFDDLGFVWDVLEYQWEEGFKHLVAYKEEFGDCFVVNNLLYRAYKLGQWVSAQRGKRKDLTIEREMRLKDIGFLWNLDQAKWEKAFKCLVAYKEEFGHCMVTKNTSMDRDFNLSSWVSNQRTNKEKLPTERRNLLNKLGFIWDVSHFKWEEGFQCLVTYKDEFGDCLVQNGSQYSGYKLSQWVGDQRENSHRLTSEQRSRLDGLGFVWNVLKYRWEEGFTNLVDYKDEFGDCRVRDKSKYRNYNLGSWVSKQRSKKGKLTSEQISNLIRLYQLVTNSVNLLFGR